MATSLATVFGGGGFVGRYVVGALARGGYRVRVVTRRPHTAHYLRPLGAVGQIQIEKGDVKDADAVHRLTEGAELVVNLVGIAHPSGGQSFEAVHEKAPGEIARACGALGVKTFVHVSAIGADPDSSSAYARTKGKGEVEAREAFASTVIVRPSIVFGPEDDFFNRFGQLSQFVPALPLIGGGKTLFQPVYAGDLAAGVAEIARSGAERKPIYEFGGPAIYSFKELLTLTLESCERQRLLVPVPFPAAKFMGAFLGILPNPILTMDQVELLKEDNVVNADGSAEIGTLEELPVVLRSVEQVVPTYLYRFRRHGQYSDEPLAES